MLHPSVRPCLGFAACSGTGKTTLLLELIPRLVAAGLRLDTAETLSGGLVQLVYRPA